MHKQTNTNPALRRARNLLQEIGDLAHEASMVEAFRGGAANVVQKYNRVLAYLNSAGFELDDLFSPLPAEATFDQVGVEARMLKGFLADEEEQESHGPQPNIVIGHLESLSSLADLEKLSELVRNLKVDVKVGTTASADVLPSQQHDDEDTETPTVRQETPTPIPMPTLTRTTV